MKQPLKIILQIFAAVYGSITLIFIWANVPKWLNRPELADKFWYGLVNGFFLFTLFIMPFILAFRYAGKPLASYWRLMGRAGKRVGNGRKAEAVVLAIDESSLGTATVNEQPYVKLKLEIQDPARKPYVVSIESVIPRLALPSFQPGSRIPVLLDQNDPDKVVIDFNS
jgi:hypothetical protein